MHEDICKDGTSPVRSRVPRATRLPRDIEADITLDGICVHVRPLFQAGHVFQWSMNAKQLTYLSDTKERPFTCVICQKSFTRKDLLKRHDRLVHAEEGEEQSAATGLLHLGHSTASLPNPGDTSRNLGHLSGVVSHNLT